jgi:hypothetical protein
VAFGTSLPVTPTHVGALVRVEVVLFLAALSAAVAYQALVGRIELRGLLSNKATGAFDAGRLQLLVATLVVAGTMVLGLPAMHKSRRVTVPEVALVYLIGGSEGIYLVRKAMQVFLQSKGE